MLRKLALLTLAAGAPALMIPTESAEARVRGYGVYHARPIYYGRPYVRPYRVYRARPFVYGYAARPYIAGDGCYWLKRRAIVTGSPYWWRRYRWCRGY
jgi:hypothetical protein